MQSIVVVGPADAYAQIEAYATWSYVGFGSADGIAPASHVAMQVRAEPAEVAAIDGAATNDGLVVSIEDRDDANAQHLADAFAALGLQPLRPT